MLGSETRDRQRDCFPDHADHEALADSQTELLNRLHQRGGYGIILPF